MNNEDIVNIRKDKIKKMFRAKKEWLFYAILAAIIYIGVRIRTLNLPGLRDITTGEWTLGPDLDPFLFLRWAKNIAANGSLYAIDNFRFVPLGFETKQELLLHPYMIAWFHKLASIFGSSSVEQSAAVYPVFFFAITIIAFFLMTKEIFSGFVKRKDAGIIALISSLFLSVAPAILPRTIAGIPEKESAAFFFMFITFYVFLISWKADDNRVKQYGLALLSGITTAGMALVWGGYVYIFLTIGIALFIAFVFGQINKNEIYVSSIWIVSSLGIMSMFSTRYAISNIFNSTTTLIPIGFVALIIIDYLIFNTNLKLKLKYERFKSIPRPLFSIIIVAILGLIASMVFFGPSFLVDKAKDVTRPLITPISDRLGVTVAENRQPYFDEWGSSFGPIAAGIPIFFWIFVIGSIYLYYKTVEIFPSRDRKIMTFFYIIFVLALIFSRYSPNGLFNGTNAASIMFYLIGILCLLGSFGFYYYRYHKNGMAEKFKSISFGIILLFALFFFSIISARGAVRLIMILVPSASIMASYLLFHFSNKAYSERGKNYVSVIIAVMLILAMIFTAFQFYNISTYTARGYVPSAYNYQWQKAMSWVRDNTGNEAVFGHWWDYGYWIQTIGERATILDGGNYIPYWNHFMGRYVLTTPNNNDALEFLYSHDATHLLIDSTDIGKYGAFSLIGSDENLDRRSSIQTFLRDNSQMIERKNTTTFIYSGAHLLDHDIIYDSNGTRIFLPGERAVVGGIILEVDNNSSKLVRAPEAIIIYDNKQYNLPINQAFKDGEKYSFDGIESGVFIFPSISERNGNINIDEFGAILYLSERTVNSQLARLYLYGMKEPGFNLVHSEDDLYVEQIKQISPKDFGEFMYYQGFRGPIKIWEIDYPSGIEINEEFLDTEYPVELTRI